MLKFTEPKLESLLKDDDKLHELLRCEKKMSSVTGGFIITAPPFECVAASPSSTSVSFSCLKEEKKIDQY